MIVNVCCAGSSGSTFLSHLLNRHPDLVCGDELGIFAKPVLYNNYDYLKQKSFLIRNFGISSNPYFLDSGVFRNLRSYNLKSNTVWSWVKESNNIRDLADKFNRYILDLTGKQIWIEKTPVNIFMASEFIKAFPDAKIIHIIRDPRDVILTKMKGGSTLEYAAEQWLASVACVQRCRNNPNVLEIRYEDLIYNSEKILKSICEHISVEYNMDNFVKDTFKSRAISKVGKRNVWNLSPDQGFTDKSIAKFKNSGINFDPIYAMKLSKEYAALLGVEEYYLVDLANRYHYALPDNYRNDCKGKVVQHKRAHTFKKGISGFIRRNCIEKEKILPRAVY